ncbi:alpha/beta hydrolase [Achromobacter xylosoxidans]|nr:alpha/beta hydrolase [Achromobacter xylosoxidans]OCZ65777.1 alpha/beta hydrolase [Achromobacter xylosoxidans]OCZ78023.1 alpha/beta hydrolase [Achromobacter xylosoxidans]
MTPYRTIRTPRLEIAYLEWNPGAARSAVLLHGWPDSPAGWRPVAQRLAAEGYRVLCPALRGFGPTRFLDPATPRSGELAALGRDLLDFIDALGLEQPLLAGHDWGARAAANACGLATGAAAQLVLLSIGYGTNDPAQVLPLPQARNYWYHWFMATPRGAAAVRDDARGFTRYLWDTWSPAGWYTEEEFAEAAQAFDNPDWAAVVLHSYRHRWGFEPGDPAYVQDGARLTPAPRLAVPTLVLHGGADTCNQPATSEGKSHYFSGGYERRVLDGVGHFPQREAPQAVAAAILNFLANPPARG